MTRKLSAGTSLLARHSVKLLAAALLAFCSGAVSAETAQASSDGYNLTFKQLGRSYSMNLHGVESTDSVAFNVRADQVVTGATLTLLYAYSPALLPELSHINILVNDEVAATLPLPKETAGSQQRATIEIPPHLITEFNRLSVQFIGHYTMSCEDPLHSSLWSKISSESSLQLRTTPLALANDLVILPLPFFDRRDARPLKLPFVFAAAPDNRTLEAAGALSSWFGALASYRGATFPVQLDSLPSTGNAIVLLVGDAAMQVAGLSVPAPKGPTVAIMPNPNDANGKLLLLTGRDAAELKRAALAVSVGSQTMTGTSVLIDKLDNIKPRKPYDAPNWLPTDRPIKLGELIPSAQLNVSGYNPGNITIPLNLPPDLFHWKQEGAPLKLKYRYTPQPQSSNSSLIVSFNDKLVKSEVLPSMQKLDKSLLSMIKNESLSRELRTWLPMNSAALQSRLQLRYMYDYIKEGECRDIIIDNMRGAIDPESTLDLTAYDHFIAMPNLGVFKDAGYPFTRMADLSQTAVVLPDSASNSDLSAYLGMLGRFGESTGYPATAVTVTQAADVSNVSDKDLLVIASGANQPLLKQWADRLPAYVTGQQQRFELSDLAVRVRSWFSPDTDENVRKTRLAMAFAGDQRGTYLTGFESPLKSGRSVVVVAGGDEEGLAHATEALANKVDNADLIQGSLVVIRGKNVEALVADEQYYVGSMSWFKYVQWLMSRHVGLMWLITALGVLLLAGLVYFGLRAKAKRRLDA